MTTRLNAPYRQRAEAKAKDTRWDGQGQKSFVPIGRDVAPFAEWLPVDPAKLANQDLVDVAKGVPLSRLLAGVATAVERCFGSPCERRLRSSGSTAIRTSNWNSPSAMSAAL